MRVAIVTGASRGIGRATALRLLDDGYYVVLASRDLDTCAHVIQHSSHPDRALPLEMDVRDTQQVQSTFERVFEHYGQLDVLVNNAGISGISPFLEYSQPTVHEIIDVNLMGVVRCCQVALPYMIPRQAGSIVNMASQAGRYGEAFNSIYSASKFAVVGLTQALAKEFGPLGIRANAVCPGPVDTEMLSQAFHRFAAVWRTASDEAASKIHASVPLGRIASASEVASVVSFLCSADANFITGACIAVTGGSTLF